MNYGEIKNCDIANGTGVRVSLFVSGCRRHCKGCFNQETWDFGYGKPFTDETKQTLMDLLRPDYIAGFSLLGGEPFEPENQAVLAGLLEEIKAAYPQKNIWCYTGNTYETDLTPGGKAYTEYTGRMLACIDKLVDGSFVEAQKDVSLAFRGSANQRIIDLSKKDRDTNLRKKTSCPVTEQSHLLAKKARMDLLEAGKTTITCPICKTTPRITTTSRGERTTVSCECGHIYDCEINF